MLQAFEFGYGNGDIFLKNVGCDGSELDITNCEYTGWNIKDCQHSEDVAVDCCKFHSYFCYYITS